jgi:hypothetical protein
VVSVEGDNLVVFYYHNASELWVDKRGGLIRGGLLSSLQLYVNMLCFITPLNIIDRRFKSFDESVQQLSQVYTNKISGRVMVFNAGIRLRT